MASQSIVERRQRIEALKGVLCQSRGPNQEKGGETNKKKPMYARRSRFSGKVGQEEEFQK